MTGLHIGALIAAALTLTGPAAGQTAIGSLVERSSETIAGDVTHVFGNKFVVTDGTGSMLVETGPSWFHDLSIEVGERVQIFGEFEDGSIDAYRILRAGGEEIKIRPAGGPPPWAGGPPPWAGGRRD
ncbi:MAG: DNA-binding protein [Rhodobacteraceae bacterium]|nr:DNA-binding protein [Paracoccaceae bacterium]